jgi:hypothetical protein
MKQELYDWQNKIVETKGNLTIRGGRQTGKSIAVAHRIIKWAMATPNGVTLITSPSERQENYLYQKVKEILGDRFRFKRRVTQKLMILPNGHKVWKFPIGRTGVFVEGLSSVDFLYVDEAMTMAERPWDAILPMLAEPSKRGLGWITLLSNTRGRPWGFFFDSFKRDDFTKISISTEDVPHVSKEFLAKERERLGESYYKAIYQGEFVETDYKFFKTEHIVRAMRLKEWKFASSYRPHGKYCIGIDPARFGKDKAGIVVAEIDGEKVRIIHKELIKRCSITELRDVVVGLHNKFNFKKFFVDGLGVGAGLVDILVELYGSKVRELDNSQKGKVDKILKVDLYANVERLMALDRLEIIQDPEIRKSLESVEYDGEDFAGVETDLAEALIRACWGIKEMGYEPKFI